MVAAMFVEEELVHIRHFMRLLLTMIGWADGWTEQNEEILPRTGYQRCLAVLQLVSLFLGKDYNYKYTNYRMRICLCARLPLMAHC